jgi:hypothetical protein
LKTKGKGGFPVGTISSIGNKFETGDVGSGFRYGQKGIEEEVFFGNSVNGKG